MMTLSFRSMCVLTKYSHVLFTTRHTKCTKEIKSDATSESAPTNKQQHVTMASMAAEGNALPRHIDQNPHKRDRLSSGTWGDSGRASSVDEFIRTFPQRAMRVDEKGFKIELETLLKGDSFST